MSKFIEFTDQSNDKFLVNVDKVVCTVNYPKKSGTYLSLATDDFAYSKNTAIFVQESYEEVKKLLQGGGE